tara:strand:+ start:337 stop:828 length:492 start_codon:yes stop_codon:yes gene_type:complete
MSLKQTHLNGEPKPFHYRDNVKIVGNEYDLKHCMSCTHDLLPKFFAKKGTRNAMGANYLQGRCKPCSNAIDKERQYIKKMAGPKPFFCECCSKTTEHLQRDHIRGTYVFRGWTCKNCNTGLGLFNDNLRGLLIGALYLEKDPQKIIDELNNITERGSDEGEKG